MSGKGQATIVSERKYPENKLKMKQITGSESFLKVTRKPQT